MHFRLYHKYLLAILSGVSLYLSWTPRNLFFMSFVALIPLFFIAEDLRKGKKSFTFFIYTFIAFLIWNALTVGWIYHSTSYGAGVTFVLNALFMSLPWLCFFAIYRHQQWLGYVSLICFYLSFEYLHFNWDINFPWLTLGNLFANNIALIQWYEYTGVAGGSLWVLVVNIIIFQLLINTKCQWQHLRHKMIPLLAAIFLPILVSIIIFYLRNQELKQIIAEHNSKNILIIQPNYDAYTEKFVVPESIQVKKTIELIDKKIDSNTRYIILPETMLPNSFWEHNVWHSEGLNMYLQFLQRHTNVSIILGASTHKEVSADYKSAAKREIILEGKPIYYETYNSAIMLNSDSTLFFYHKSQLVPAAEKMPYLQYLTFLNDLMLDLGGTSGALGVQDSVSVFYALHHMSSAYNIAPAICYESIYGKYMTEFVKKGANIISILTNDGWWYDTDGYKQHATYSQMRAIENRKYIYRSANTGISLVLNPLGQRTHFIDWNSEGVIKAPLYKQHFANTFYTQCPDLIYILCTIGAACIGIYQLFIKRWKSKKTNTQA